MTDRARPCRVHKEGCTLPTDHYGECWLIDTTPDRVALRRSILRLVAITISTTPSSYTPEQTAERVIERLEMNGVEMRTTR